MIDRSTMKYELIALNKCNDEAEWLCYFLKDIPNLDEHIPPICIHCDSQAANGRVQTNMCTGKSRHIHGSHNIIKQLLTTGVTYVDYVRSKNNIVEE